MIEKAYEILKTYFGYSEFRYGQKELITNLINGTDCLANIYKIMQKKSCTAAYTS